MTVIALATLFVACKGDGDVTALRDPDPKGTKWILEFDAKTKVRSPDGFVNALNKVKNKWEQNIQVDGYPTRNFSKIPIHPNYTTQTVHYPKPNDGIASQHVTQHLGLYSDEDLEKVKKQLQIP